MSTHAVYAIVNPQGAFDGAPFGSPELAPSSPPWTVAPSSFWRACHSHSPSTITRKMFLMDSFRYGLAVMLQLTQAMTLLWNSLGSV